MRLVIAVTPFFPVGRVCGFGANVKWNASLPLELR
jgi:hypothetical protein